MTPRGNPADGRADSAKRRHHLPGDELELAHDVGVRHAGEERAADQMGHAVRLHEPLDRGDAVRSEEHTSELQSPCNLVCRLLLEKKKKKQKINKPKETNRTIPTE